MYKYGMPTKEAAELLEAWFRHQSKSDLRQMLLDPDIPEDQAEYVRGILHTS